MGRRARSIFDGFDGMSRKSPLFVAGLLSLGYALLCGLYIVTSTALATRIARSQMELAQVEQWKGLAFVGVTALLFFGFAWCVLRIVERQRVALEEQSAALEAAERRMVAGDLATAIGHDIANVLSVSNLLLRELDETIAEGQSVSSVRNELQATIDGIAGLSRSLLDLGRPCADGHRTNLDLSDLVRRTVALARRHPRIRACQVFLTAPPSLWIEADAKRLERSLLNLLLNAAEATEGCGTIDVRLYVADGHVRLEVHDDGPGIPKDERKVVFDAYYTTKPSGAGIGLYSTRRTAESLGGHAEALDSDLRGACIRMSIPVEHGTSPARE